MKYTFKDFQKEYPTDEACLAKIMQINYGGTEFECPGCFKPSKFSRIAKRRAYACQWCGHHIYPCSGTIFDKSSTDLTKWFFAMYMFTSTRHGVAAKELQRQLGVTYKCAWRMAHEFRKLMAAADHHDSMGGHVEIDETFIGGKQSRKSRKRRSNKVAVVGLVERGGIIRAAPIKDTTQNTLEPIVLENVEIGSILSTDENRAYGDLANSGYDHGTVIHSKEEYVRGIHHVNTLEGHWSQLKRSIRGTHVHVSPKHLWKYVSEFSYRRNFRHSHSEMFNRLVSYFSLPRLIET